MNEEDLKNATDARAAGEIPCWVCGLHHPNEVRGHQYAPESQGPGPAEEPGEEEGCEKTPGLSAAAVEGFTALAARHPVIAATAGGVVVGLFVGSPKFRNHLVQLLKVWTKPSR